MIKISSAIFKTFFLSLCIVANTHFAFAQTASILPPGYTQYLDSNGKPLSAGKVYNYIPSTTTPKTTWQDAAETIPNANPVILDAGGRAKILGDGSYRQIVKDRNNVTIWDAVTSSTGSGSSSPTATGDGDLVGTIKPWAGMTAPNQYAFTYGQEVSRTTYSALYTAITSTQSVFCNSGSPTLNGLSDTTNFWIGMSVEVTCVAAGFSTIISKTSSTVTLAANANVTANVTAIFYPWGRGNGTTTFNLPDLRGLIPAGNNNMGGVASANLTTTYFGATNPNSAGALGGSQSYSLLRSDLPNVSITPTFTGTSTGTLTSNQTNVVVSSGAVNASGTGAVSWGQGAVTIPAFTPAGTISAIQLNGGVAQTPFSLISPTRTTNFIIKITPDANSATASGVTSLGGMTGSIACGAGLTCTGNTISETTPITVSAPILPLVNPSSGNLYGTGCSDVHQIWWVDQNLCSTADVWQIRSSDPSAGFSLTLSGSITAGDVISLTITMASGLCSGAGCTVSTGALTGADTLGTAAGKLACAIANNASLFRINGGTCAGGVVTPASGQSYGGYGSGNPIGYVVIITNGVAFDFNSLIAMQVTSSVSGAATEVVTIDNTNCGVRCSYSLDNNPAIQLVRRSGAAPQQGSTIASIYSIGATDACPTTECVNYGNISMWVDSSAVGSLHSAWLLQTLNTAGTLNAGFWFGQGMFANAGGAPFTSSSTKDKGANSVNLGIDGCYYIGYTVGGTLGNKICQISGSGQFIIQTEGTDQIILSAAAGVGINTSTTGNTFTSALGTFISGSQVPTASANGLGLIGGATPTITARNYGTSTGLPLALRQTILTAGVNGSTNPALTVDASVASAATGIQITSAAAGSRVAASVISSGTNEGLDIDAKGSGTIRLANTSTGNTIIGNSGATTTFNSTTGAITGTGNFTITRATGILSENLTSSDNVIQVSYTGVGGIQYYFKDSTPALTNPYFFIQVGNDGGGNGLTHFHALDSGGAAAFDFIHFLHNTGQTQFGVATASTSSTTGGVIFSGGIGVAGAIWAGTYLATGVVAVASLPACGAGIKGARMFVNNATATTFASTVAGGGANNVPVVCDGTNWIIG